MDVYRRLVTEVRDVAEAEGIALPEDLLEGILSFVEGAEPSTTSSMYYDLTHDKPMELEALNGELVRRGREHGVPVPTNEAVYAILKPWAVRNAR
jgi:2-dehydropantoate 2-reductase